MSSREPIAAALAVLVAALAVAACGSDNDSEGSSNAGLPQGSEPVDLNPADFTTEIDNPYWPMAPGSRWVYRETDSEGTKQRVVVTVTPRTKKIANGVEARVVHDEVTENGRPVEVTDDWYAQDSEGNIWYLGEDTTEYEGGKPVSTAGSFEAGKDGAQPGIIMPADPEAGLTYRQEYYAGEAEDEGEIVSLDEQAEVPFGHFLERPDDQGHQPAGAEGARVQVLRAGRRPGSGGLGVRRQRPRGAGELHPGRRGYPALAGRARAVAKGRQALGQLRLEVGVGWPARQVVQLVRDPRSGHRAGARRCGAPHRGSRRGSGRPSSRFARPGTRARESGSRRRPDRAPRGAARSRPSSSRGGTPAASRMVGARSMFAASWLRTWPAGKPGPRMISGTRTDSS